MVALVISARGRGVNAEWFSFTIILVLLVAVLTLRPLVSNSTGLLIEWRPAFKVGT